MDIRLATTAGEATRRASENVCTHCEIESVLEVPDKRLNDGGWMWRKSETTTKATRLAPKFKKIRRTLKAHFRRSSRRASGLCGATQQDFTPNEKQQATELRHGSAKSLMGLQRSAKRLVRGCEKFLPALA